MRQKAKKLAIVNCEHVNTDSSLVNNALFDICDIIVFFLYFFFFVNALGLLSKIDVCGNVQ
jgi:hypothetical protein